jgi:crotonobetainyl-CoA:carnitine CoA-transferase CaiB-like acyl-CoA transferase
VMANQGMNYLATGNAPKRLGNAHPNIVPYAVFDCADGFIIIASGNDGQFGKLCKLLGLSLGDRFATNADRLANRDELTAILTAETSKWTKVDLLSACEAHGVPAGPINDMEEVFADPHIVARGMRVDLDGVPSVRLPVVFSGGDTAPKTASPKLGPSVALNVVSAAASASMTRFAEATNLSWSVMCAKRCPVRASQPNQVWPAWVKNQSKLAQHPYDLHAVKAR